MLHAWDCVIWTHYSQGSQFPNNLKEKWNEHTAKLLIFLDNIKTSLVTSAELSESLESNSDLHLLKCSLLKIRSKLLSTRKRSFI